MQTQISLDQFSILMYVTSTTPIFPFKFTEWSTNPCCEMKIIWWKETLCYYQLKQLIALSMASCPFTTLMNALVIIAVKTRPDSILLACLAGTDLLVGVDAQPSFIMVEIFVLDGSSPADYWCYLAIALRMFFIPPQHSCPIWL